MNAEAKTWDVFISYSTKDIDIIQKIVRDLQERGISYWLDEEQINPGDLILDAIEQGLRHSRAIMPCFSRKQLQSGWSRAEYSTILNQFLGGQTAQKIYPLLLDDITEDKLSLFFRNIKCTRHIDTNNYTKLLDTLHREAQQRHSGSQSNELESDQTSARRQNFRETPVNENEQEQVRNLLPHFIHDQYVQGKFKGYFEALTMFVDASGFTPMTQALMKHGREGAGVLATVMNDIFNRLVETVYEWGGFVSTFAGDAFTAIFPLPHDNSAEATVLYMLTCVDRLQALFRGHGIQTTPYGQFALHFKVGLSQGEVNWGIPGKDQKTYYFRGEAIDRCAKAEHYADKGHVILDKNITEFMMTIPCFAERILDVNAVEAGFYRLNELPSDLLQEVKSPSLTNEPLNQDVLAHFLSDTVFNFKGMGEFRQIIPIFIAFEGISTFQQLSDWTSVLIKHLKGFGGHFNHLDFGDKGNLVLCAFGAPIVHEDMVDFALDFLLALRQELKQLHSLSELRWKAGMTHGTAFTGIVGGTKRCEYTYYGEIVNLAARLMDSAEWGEIFVSELVYKRTLAVFEFEFKGECLYKGFVEPIPTYMLLGRKSRLGVAQKLETAIIGRQTELLQLLTFVAPIFEGKFAGIAYIHGEAGIGKSRLAYALQERLTQQNITWFRCRAEQIVRKPLNPFISCLMQYFTQVPEDTESQKKRRFSDTYRALILKCQRIESEAATTCVKELERTKSIIGAQIGVSWKGSLWNALDAKGKRENTLAALKNFFLTHSLLAPVVIELEDGHWLDSESVDFLKILTRKITGYPIFIFSTLRYHDDGSKIIFSLEGIREKQIELQNLSVEEAKRFAEAEMNGSLSEDLDAFLWEKAHGNPLFLQQLLRYMVEQNVIAFTDNVWRLTTRMVGVPVRIQEILAARIDRLPKETQEVVRASAVIGQEFDLVLLSSILKKDVFSQVTIIEEAKIWEAMPESQYGFRFKHALLRDTGYERQLEADRREFHRLIAERMEKLPTIHLKKHYVDVAVHYEQAKNNNKAIEYLEKGGDEAKDHYQNQQALDLYNRLLDLIVVGRPTVKIDALLKKAEILELIGACFKLTDSSFQGLSNEGISDTLLKSLKSLKDKEFTLKNKFLDAVKNQIGKEQIDKYEKFILKHATINSQALCEEALHLSEQIDDKPRMGGANLLSGIIFRRTGQFDKAMTHFEQAMELFEAVKDREGIRDTFKNIGIIYDYQGDYDMAMTYYGKALTISKELEDTLGIAKSANNIGIINYEIKGDFDAAMAWWQKSLKISKEEGEKLERPKVLNNIGECYRSQGKYSAAITFYEKALKLYRELGDKLGTAIALGNIGHVYKAQGDYDRAIGYYDRTIAIDRELESQYYLGEHLIDKTDVLFSLQRYDEAQALNVEGFQIAEKIGDKEYIFKSKVLSAKIAIAMGNKDALQRFKEMLQQTQDDVKIATLHYELWKMTHNKNHRQRALDLYQTLYERTPNIDYKTRIEEMIKNSSLGQG